MKHKQFILASVAALFSVCVMAEVHKGVHQYYSSDNPLYWAYDDETGTLTLSGYGNMDTYREIPWNQWAHDIQHVIVRPNVEELPPNAFEYCDGIVSVTWEAINCAYDRYHNSSSIRLFSASSATLSSFVFGDKVSVIPECLCRGLSGISSINIPSSVKKIKYEAFSKCTGMAELTIANGVTEIEENAFRGCVGLTSLTLPSSLTKIGSNAFASCSGLTKLIIPAGIKEISSNAFSDCVGLTSITIPSSVTSIGSDAFSGCKAITDVTWNAINCRTEDQPFYSATKITSFTFGENVQWIPSYLCKGLSCMTSVILPNSVTSIGAYAFANCSQLRSIAIPNAVTTINAGAFANCAALQQISLPSDITMIGDEAFLGCKLLTSVTIPTKVRFIGKSAFEGCAGLKSVVVPNSVTRIGDSAFKGCSGLTSVTLTNSVTLIGSEAFYGCSSLQSIEIPNSVTQIQKKAFAKCIQLQNVKIGSKVTSIGDYAFMSCIKLTSITIPSTVTVIGNEAFSSYTVLHVASDVEARYRNMSTLSSYQIVADAKQETSSQYPPLLTLVENTLQFVDPNYNSAIDANEQCQIQFQITNQGKSTANGCIASISGTGSTTGLSFVNVVLPAIPVGSTYTVVLPINTNLDTQDGTVNFTIEVTEPNGYGIEPMTASISTRAYESPMLTITDYKVSGNGTLQRRQPVDLQLLLQNIKHGTAEDVTVTLKLPDGVTLFEGQQETQYKQIKDGEQHTLDYKLMVSGNYAPNEVPIHVAIREKHGRFAQDKDITLKIQQQLTSSPTLVVKAQPMSSVPKQEITVGSLSSAVDKNIPTCNTTNQNTFAFIIANETYEQVAAVPMALNDGVVFQKYCQQTLGLPKDNIKYYPNATLGNMASAVSKAQEIANAYHGNVDIIFYYAGHGIPDEKTKSAYLLPVDVDGRQTSLCYSVDKLYKDLAATNANRIFVFLDACFSGSERGNGMLASARGVAIKAQSGVPQGNMLVMCAATGDQTAYPLESEGHGMFTYYLLEKLQQTSGDVTMFDLFNYIRDNVEQKSSVTIKTQTPTIILSRTLSDEWQSWTLKKE